MVSPENTHTSDIIKTEQGVFMYLEIYSWQGRAGQGSGGAYL